MFILQDLTLLALADKTRGSGDAVLDWDNRIRVSLRIRHRKYSQMPVSAWFGRPSGIRVRTEAWQFKVKVDAMYTQWNITQP